MKKEYIKPSMTAIELQHMTRLLAGSGDVRSLQSSGWVDPEDELILAIKVAVAAFGTDKNQIIIK